MSETCFVDSFLDKFFKDIGGLFFRCNNLTSINVDENNENYLEAFLRSVGCGAMMFIAVNGYNKTKNVLMVIMPVMVFILCGFDHCIANFGYMAMENQFFSWRLPVWIVGNTVGSMMISKI